MKLPANTEGKPTEMTGVPQPPKPRSAPMEGIVKGLACGMTTRQVDGIVSGLPPMTKGKPTMKVPPSATKKATQEFGNIPFQASAYGR